MQVRIMYDYNEYDDYKRMSLMQVRILMIIMYGKGCH